MPSFCVNTNPQPNGDHEVHNVTTNHGCLPAPANRQDLGYHPDCASAVRKARLSFPQVDGCAWCAPAYHTR